MGLQNLSEGQVYCEGTLAHIPSERYSMGLIRSFTVAENLLLREIDRPPFTRWGWLRPKAIARYAKDLVERYLIRTPRWQPPAAVCRVAMRKKWWSPANWPASPT